MSFPACHFFLFIFLLLIKAHGASVTKFSGLYFDMEMELILLNILSFSLMVSNSIAQYTRLKTSKQCECYIRVPVYVFSLLKLDLVKIFIMLFIEEGYIWKNSRKLIVLLCRVCYSSQGSTAESSSQRWDWL